MGLIEELARHGYKLSPGTLYPLPHGLEKEGYLTSQTEYINGRQRRAYTATKAGQQALLFAKSKVWELFNELFEEEFNQQKISHSFSKKGTSLKAKKSRRR